MEFKIFDLGPADYNAGWQLQQNILNQVKCGFLDFALVLCRHHPVVTFGRKANPQNFKAPKEELERKGIRVLEVERGGDVTYHGPGQITAYPIFNLACLKKDIHWFLRQLEEVGIGLAAEFSIKAERRPGLTGVWVGNEKIASIGIAVRNWVTFHGISINVSKDDLRNFDFIRPCGMDSVMASLENFLGRAPDMAKINEKLIRKFQDTFFVKPRVSMCKAGAGLPCTVKKEDQR